MSDDAGLILRVAARGEGVTADGRFVPLAAPGDRLTADGALVPGPNRQPPPCQHFPRCGGCQLQHLRDASYADYLADRVAGALAAQDLSADIRTPLLSPPHSRRRAALHAEKRGGSVALGYSEAASHQLVDLAACPVLLPALVELLAPLRRLLAGMMPAGRRAELQLTMLDQGVDLLITGVEAEGLAAAEALSDFAERHRLARLSIDTGLGPETRWEPDAATITLGGVAVPFPPGSFLQATVQGEAALVAAVRDAIGTPALIADLFAGLGTFALAQAVQAKIYAAEGGRDVVLAMKSAAGRAQRQLFADHRDLYRRPLTPAELDRFQAVILDPPRAGAREQAEAIAQSAVPVIAYVSCNPGTFGRDAKIICGGGYRLDWVQPVGQFRWSTHVELAARFSRQG